MDISTVQKIAVCILPLLFAITLHEVAHGYVASICGDQTARMQGRLSLNPIRHIDPFGTVILPCLMLLFTPFVFGWAKPVPVDPRNFRRLRVDSALVAFAGPFSNILMAVFWGLVQKLAMSFSLTGAGYWTVPLAYMGQVGVSINVVLAVLNLLPIPPLDGSRIVSSLLPPRLAARYNEIEQYGIWILLALILTGLLQTILIPFYSLLMNLIITMLGL